LYPENAAYLATWDAEAWPMLALFDALGLDEVRRRFAATARQVPAWPVPGLPAAGTEVAQRQAEDDELRARRRVLGSALSSLTYERPLHLVRGEGSRMFDRDGRAYLDAYNNVPVVGHSHPRVVTAIARQAATLNTNTRYLHRTVIDLAERLVATMPPGLDTVMFVNSGSEANDLAEHPQFYNTLTANCNTMIFSMVRALSPSFPLDWRIVLNGFLPSFFYDHGFVDTSIPFTDLIARAAVTDRIKMGLSEEAFGARLRDGLPNPN